MASKGDAFKAEGHKCLNRSTIFGFGTQRKYEDAVDNFTKAGNAYKLANQWQSAGDVFLIASDCHLKLDSASDSLNAMVEAANCFKKISPQDAIDTLIKAIEKYNESGRFSQSAKYHKEVAELYEAEHNVEMAINHYNEAAQLFNNENKKQSANPCLLKIATLASEADNFVQAAGIYETIGRESLETKLGSYSAKGHFLHCVLCHLAAGDAVAAANKIEAFKNADYSFGSSRECGFIEKLVQATNDSNDEEYSTACAEFDRITPLDPYKTSLLLKAKRHIAAAAGDEDMDLT